MAAEALALLDGLDDALFLNKLFNFSLDRECPILCVTDSKTLYAAIHSSETVHEKRLGVDISAIQELMSNKLVCEERWVDTKSQIANIFTKKGADSGRILFIIRKNFLDFTPKLPC